MAIQVPSRLTARFARSGGACSRWSSMGHGLVASRSKRVPLGHWIVRAEPRARSYQSPLSSAPVKPALAGGAGERPDEEMLDGRDGGGGPSFWRRGRDMNAKATPQTASNTYGGKPIDVSISTITIPMGDVRADCRR